MSSIGSGFYLTPERLLPHSGSMLFIKNIINCTGCELTCVVIPNLECLFASNGMVPTWVGIEYMAQAAAIFSNINYISKDVRGQSAQLKPKSGFLVGVRNYEIREEQFICEKGYYVKVKSLYNDSDFNKFDSIITSCDSYKIVATGVISTLSSDGNND